jgi:hypothetical protein
MATQIIGNQIASSTVALMTSLTLSGNFRLPALTTANRPSSPNAGQMIFDTDLDNVIVWRLKTGPTKSTAAWAVVGAGGPSVGTNSIVRTNAPTISENITIGPTANGGAEFTNGFSGGPITLANGYTLTIESGASYVVIGNDDFSGSGAFFETFENVAVYNTLKLPDALLEFGKTREYITMTNSPSGTVVYNFNSSNIWYGTNPPLGNWTANLVNVPTDNMFAFGITIITFQGTAAGLPTSLQINGSNQTIRWNGNSTPTASTSGKYDITSFSFIRVSDNWIVQGSNSSFG